MSREVTDTNELRQIAMRHTKTPQNEHDVRCPGDVQTKHFLFRPKQTHQPNEGYWQQTASRSICFCRARTHQRHSPSRSVRGRTSLQSPSEISRTLPVPFRLSPPSSRAPSPGMPSCIIDYIKVNMKPYNGARSLAWLFVHRGNVCAAQRTTLLYTLGCCSTYILLHVCGNYTQVQVLVDSTRFVFFEAHLSALSTVMMTIAMSLQIEEVVVIWN